MLDNSKNKMILMILILYSASILINPALADIGFVEVTTDSITPHIGPSYGVSWGDFNNDGYPDAWVGNHYEAPNLYINNGDGTFTDIRDTAWPGDIRDAHGAAWGDFDNDGDQDLIEMVGSGNDNNFYVNDNGVFRNEEQAWGIGLSGARSRSPTLLDWNNDGLIDVFITQAIGGNDFPMLMTNTGQSFFDDSSTTGVALQASDGAYLADFNNGGPMEIALAVTSLRGFPGALYDISQYPFAETADQYRQGLGFVSEAIIADFNKDFRNDMLLIPGGGSQQLTQSSPNFIEVAFVAIPNEERAVSFQSNGLLSISFWGHDPNLVFVGSTNFIPEHTRHDELGWGSFTIILDPTDPLVDGTPSYQPGIDAGIFISFDGTTNSWFIGNSSFYTNAVNMRVLSSSDMQNVNTINFIADPIASRPNFMVQDENGVFQEQKQSAGLNFSMPCTFGVAADFDNDKDIDIYLSCARAVTNEDNILLENNGDGTFIVVPNAGGAAGSTSGRSDSMAIADYDLDGYLDIFLVNGLGAEPFLQGPHQLFRNTGSGNNWVELDLVGTISNPHGIGAIVRLTADGDTQLREQNSGMHKRAQNFQRIHFGLGASTTITTLEVSWPSGCTQVLSNVDANQILNIVENCGNNLAASSVSVPTVPLLAKIIFALLLLLILSVFQRERLSR